LDGQLSREGVRSRVQRQRRADAAAATALLRLSPGLRTVWPAV
jgi:hypothetical protein